MNFNTKKRAKAKNEFEKAFFKLMNNSVFGKCMENVNTYMDMMLTTKESMAVKYFSKNTVQGRSLY